LLHDFEEIRYFQDKNEKLKLSLLQAFPSEELFKTFFPPSSSIPDEFEQRVPETDEEFADLENILSSIFTGGEKSIGIDQLIKE